MDLDRSLGTKNRENLALFLICVLVLFRNFFLLIEGLGEPDAARLLNDAIVWSKAGYLDPALTEYRARISPLYIYALKNLVDFSVPYGTIVYAMNAANAIAGSLTFLVAFKFFRLFLPFNGTVFASIVLAFAPSAFLASIYGMPHTLGFFFFFLSLNVFTAALLSPERHSKPAWPIGVPSLCLAAAIKADILLCGGAFLGVLIYAGKTSLPDLTKAGLWIAAATLTPLLLHGAIVPEVASAAQALTFASQWSEKYSISLANWASAENALVMALFVGPVFLLLFIAATLAALKSTQSRCLAILVLLWTVPLILFWGVRPGNSARHLLPAVIPIALMLGWAATRVSRTHLGRGSFALAAVIANYVWIPPMGNTVAPSTQILNSTSVLQQKIEGFMAMGREIDNTGGADHVLIGTGTLPYMIFNVISKADKLAIEADGYRITTQDGASLIVRPRYVRTLAAAKLAARNALDRGRRVWTLQADLETLLRDLEAPPQPRSKAQRDIPVDG